MQFRQWDVPQIFSNTKPTELEVLREKKTLKAVGRAAGRPRAKALTEAGFRRKLSILSASSRGHSSRKKAKTREQKEKVGKKTTRRPC